MADEVLFDHIEVHVSDIEAYCRFLKRLFKGGRYKEISESGTSMFITPDGVNIEVKARPHEVAPGEGGFRLPCIRLESARAHLDELEVEIQRKLTNPEGEVFFFRDPEGIEWHAKDYLHRDRYINW